MAMLETMSIIGTIMVLMLLLLLIIILFVCKPWRFLPRSRSSPFSTFKVGDLQRPLVSHDENLIQGQTSEASREFDLEEACFQNEGLLRSSLTEGRGVYKPRLPSSSSSPHLAQAMKVARKSKQSTTVHLLLIEYMGVQGFHTIWD